MKKMKCPDPECGGTLKQISTQILSKGRARYYKCLSCGVYIRVINQ